MLEGRELLLRGVTFYGELVARDLVLGCSGFGDAWGLKFLGDSDWF